MSDQTQQPSREELQKEVAQLREEVARARQREAELKRIQRELQQSEEMLNHAGRLARVGGWEVNLQKDSVTWTEATRLMFGVELDYNPTLQEAIEFYTEDARPLITQQVNNAIETGESYEITLPIINKQGKELYLHSVGIPVMEDGQCVRLWGVIQDVTKHIRVTEELRQSEERYRLITENIEDLITVTNTKGNFVYVSPSVHNLLGFSPEEYMQFSTVDNVHPEDQPALLQIRQAYGEAIRNEEDFSTTAEFRVRHKGGHWVWLQARSSMFKGFGDQAGYFTLIVSRDITQQRQADEERRKLEQSLLHAQKLESLGVLAGGIAHDFNNILAGIIGNADLALMDISQSSPAYDCLNDISKAAAHAANLTRQMLAYSGKGRFVVKQIDLQKVIEEMVSMISVSISKSAVLRYDFAPDLPRVEADATQLRQVIMNLVTNASEAIGDKSGVISIHTGAMYCDEDYLQETFLNEFLPEGSYVFVEIADTGCGMDSETQAKIFDPFFTTKFTGRGLGLAAVLGIIRGHKGAIKVYSEPRRGTTFKFFLPAVDAGVSEEEEVTEEARFEAGGTILLADDEETVRAVGKRMLKRLGFDVILAGNGREAVSLYQRHRNSITCVLLDLTMPHLDGESAFREMRLLDPKVRVVLSSGYNEQEIINRFAGKGLAGFIQKPYKLSTLREVLASVLHKDRGDSQNPEGDG